MYGSTQCITRRGGWDCHVDGAMHFVRFEIERYAPAVSVSIKHGTEYESQPSVHTRAAPTDQTNSHSKYQAHPHFCARVCVFVCTVCLHLGLQFAYRVRFVSFPKLKIKQPCYQHTTVLIGIILLVVLIVSYLAYNVFLSGVTPINVLAVTG